MPYICQDRLPFSPWSNEATRRLPGVQPIKPTEFFFIDEVFNLQMQYRDELIRTKRNQIFFNDLKTDNTCDEVLDFVLEELRNNKNYSFNGNNIRRPDGIEVNLETEDPLILAARLVQEDLLVLKKEGQQHILRAGVLCFPASWTLSEKKNKTLTSIHGPVKEYSDNIAQRVEKMFSNLNSKTPIGRANFLLYDDYELFQPRLEKDEKGISHKKLSQFLRVERQTLKKFVSSSSILFSIHTFVVPYTRLTMDQKNSLDPFLL